MEPIVTEYYTITDESMARESERLFEKARHDEAQALYNARRKGFLEGLVKVTREWDPKAIPEIARPFKHTGMPLEQIAQITGLSIEEIEKL